MRSFYLIFIIAFIAWLPKPTGSGAQQLISADKAFSELSRQKGMKYAFLKYIDDQGVLLRPNHYPLVGYDAKELLSKANDTTFTLTWEPKQAFIAKSGELGYTYGVYTTQTRDTTLHGTYVSIWRKQKDGSWKFVLDTGNAGLGK